MASTKPETNSCQAKIFARAISHAAPISERTQTGTHRQKKIFHRSAAEVKRNAAPSTPKASVNQVKYRKVCAVSYIALMSR